MSTTVLNILPRKKINSARRRRWLNQVLGSCWLLLLAACSGREEPAKLPLPTGHYEGPVTYQGTDLRVTLDVREPTPGQLQADLHFPDVAGLSFPVAKLRYKEPQLYFEQEPGQPGNITVSAIREGDFLRGMFTWDTIQTEFVWARRGQAAPRPYREQSARLPGVGGAGRPEAFARFLIPQDTALRYPAVVLLPDAATVAAAATRANLLARHGFVVLLLPAPARPDTPDSVLVQRTSAALRTCRAEGSVDSSRVGVWVRGRQAPAVATAVAEARPAVTFVILEGVPIASNTAAKPFQRLARQRIPLLGLYGTIDTTAQATESARRLRAAIGFRRGNAVRVYPKANRNLTIAGFTTSKGQWQWPQPAPGYADELLTWLRQQTTK